MAALTKSSGALAALALAALALAPGQAEAAKRTGCYIGAAAGVASSTDKAALQFAGVDVLTIDAFGSSGIAGTITGGCDYQLDRLVVGLWSDYTWHDQSVKLGIAFGGANLEGHVDLQDSWAIGGRLGVELAPSVMVYGLLGYTRASFSDMSASFNGVGVGSIGVPDMKGYVLGVGAEIDLPMPGLNLDLRYTYSKYDREDIGIGFGAAIGFEPEVHYARVGLNWRFQAPSAPPATPMK